MIIIHLCLHPVCLFVCVSVCLCVCVSVCPCVCVTACSKTQCCLDLPCYIFASMVCLSEDCVLSADHNDAQLMIIMRFN
jgi:hypothetical protein